MRGLAKTHTGITHRHRQSCGDGQRAERTGLGGDGQKWGIGAAVIVYTMNSIKTEFKKDLWNIELYYARLRLTPSRTSQQNSSPIH